MSAHKALALVFLSSLLRAQVVEKGSFTLHSLLHAIGEEHYEVTRGDGGRLAMNASFETSDRGTRRSLTAALGMRADLTPETLEVKGRTTQSFVADAALPPRFFVGFGHTPYSVQMMMVRYWAAHGKPERLPILPADPAAAPIRIEFAGHDSIAIDGKAVRLDRFTVSGLLFGREVLWMNDQAQLAAVMTFGGGLPFEAVRTEYEPALSQLFHSGVAQQMSDFSAFGRQTPPEKTGSFAIAGATLVDGTDRPPVPDSVVIIRDGRIAAAGPRSQVAIPKGMVMVNAAGQMLLPGLWEMHTHFSGFEFGPALLAAGVTTARDCGGEFEFLVAIRDAIEKRRGPGPRLLLAGLVDASGPGGFGAVTADTPEEARAVVAKYKAAGFQQIKLYTLLKPEVIAALAAEAHRVGMTVTGHVPSSVTTFEGVELGMDQINHLTGVFQAMRPAGSRAPIDFESEQVHTAIQFLKDHHTVIDPTSSWGEMAGHSKDMDVPSFEPGIARAPYTLASKFMAMGQPESESARVHARMTETLGVIGALHKAGITIVPGSDTGLLGFGLHRELELYVQAGMKPIEAIQAATIVSARAMKLDRESGTIEAGKRADLILVDGNPLENISDIRKVSRVIANGWLYDSGKLWKSVGFRN